MHVPSTSNLRLCHLNFDDTQVTSLHFPECEVFELANQARAAM